MIVSVVGSTFAGQNCRFTKSAETYLGTIATTTDDKPCVSWVETWPEAFSHGESPEEAGIYCRNPDSDVNGPWCFTDAETYDWGYCDIPYCCRYYMSLAYIDLI